MRLNEINVRSVEEHINLAGYVFDHLESDGPKHDYYLSDRLSEENVSNLIATLYINFHKQLMEIAITPVTDDDHINNVIINIRRAANYKYGRSGEWTINVFEE